MRLSVPLWGSGATRLKEHSVVEALALTMQALCGVAFPAVGLFPDTGGVLDRRGVSLAADVPLVHAKPKEQFGDLDALEQLGQMGRFVVGHIGAEYQDRDIDAFLCDLGAEKPFWITRHVPDQIVRDIKQRVRGSINRKLCMLGHGSNG
ncbi:hypothetical protein [Pandoraea pnomenusa]|uniref:hypothetical protein n=1 Tax=Pandoraea pnomenusa TaxID=93220 RepID=UPI0033423292